MQNASKSSRLHFFRRGRILSSPTEPLPPESVNCIRIVERVIRSTWCFHQSPHNLLPILIFVFSCEVCVAKFVNTHYFSTCNCIPDSFENIGQYAWSAHKHNPSPFSLYSLWTLNSHVYLFCTLNIDLPINYSVNLCTCKSRGDTTSFKAVLNVSLRFRFSALRQIQRITREIMTQCFPSLVLKRNSWNYWYITKQQQSRQLKIYPTIQNVHQSNCSHS